MNVREIQAGKTYYHVTAGNEVNKRSTLKEKNVSKIFVLEVDVQKNRVLASVGGTPAQWVEMKRFCRWKTIAPEAVPKHINQCDCGASGTIKTAQEKRTITYHGETITAKFWVYKCSHCKAKFTTDESDKISLNEYKKKHETTKSGLHIGASEKA